MTSPVFIPPDLLPYSIASLYDRLLLLMSDALEATPNGRPANVGIYHGPQGHPADLVDDQMSVVAEGWQFSGGVTSSMGQPAAFPMPWRGPITYNLYPVVRTMLELRRIDWPLPNSEDANNPFPPFAETTQAAANLAIDAHTMIDALHTDMMRPLGSSVLSPTGPLLASFVSCDPIPPQGGSAGWRIHLMFGFDTTPCSDRP